jgi:hypothetical protein
MSALGRSDDEMLREAIRDLLLRHAKGVLSPRAAEDELFGHIADLCDDARNEERRSFERLTHAIRCDRAELTREVRSEMEDLLYIARRAARKLETMYMRGECSRRNELDELLRASGRLAWMTAKLRADRDAVDVASQICSTDLQGPAKDE